MTPTVAEQVLDEIHALGIRVRADGEQIRFSPKDAMPPALAERARACKAELIELLVAKRPRPSQFLIDGRMREILWLDQIGLPPHSFCSMCGLKRWWRLRGADSPARPWACARCDPPPPPDQFEWAKGCAP